MCGSSCDCASPLMSLHLRTQAWLSVPHGQLLCPLQAPGTDGSRPPLGLCTPALPSPVGNVLLEVLQVPPPLYNLPAHPNTAGFSSCLAGNLWRLSDYAPSLTNLSSPERQWFEEPLLLILALVERA